MLLLYAVRNLLRMYNSQLSQNLCLFLFLPVFMPCLSYDFVAYLFLVHVACSANCCSATTLNLEIVPRLRLIVCMLFIDILRSHSCCFLLCECHCDNFTRENQFQSTLFLRFIFIFYSQSVSGQSVMTSINVFFRCLMASTI